jgi:hypothetical protein
MKKIVKYEDILNNELLLKVDELVEKLMNDKNSNFTTSTLLWQKELIGSSTPVLRYVLSHNEREVYNLLKNEIESKIPYKIESIMIYLWPNLSHITWHNDGVYTAGLTIYLNKFWDKNWGGLFLYEEIDEIKAIAPKRNLGVLQIGGVEHATTTVNYGADFRITLQMFFNNKRSTI